MPTYAQNESIHDQHTYTVRADAKAARPEERVPILIPRSRLKAAVRATSSLAVTATEAINITVDLGLAALDAATLEALLGTEPKRKRPSAQAEGSQ
jgi:hypothetical protein